MTHLDKMILRLYMGPVFLLVVAALAQHMAGGLVENSRSGMIAGVIANGLTQVIYWAVAGLLAWAALWFLLSSWRLWKWHQGESGEQCCHHCGGLMDSLNGRYGGYYKCLACGRTESH